MKTPIETARQRGDRATTSAIAAIQANLNQGGDGKARAKNQRPDRVSPKFCSFLNRALRTQRIEFRKQKVRHARYSYEQSFF
jgi:hypothetical protein